MVKVRSLLLIICSSLGINIDLVRFLIKVLYTSYSQPLSMVESGNGSMHLLLIQFTHGNSSRSYFYVCTKNMTMIFCVRKLNLFREMKMNLLLISIQGLYRTIIDLMMMAGHQKKTLIH